NEPDGGSWVAVLQLVAEHRRYPERPKLVGPVRLHVTKLTADAEVARAADLLGVAGSITGTVLSERDIAKPFESAGVDVDHWSPSETFLGLVCALALDETPDAIADRCGSATSYT